MYVCVCVCSVCRVAHAVANSQKQLNSKLKKQASVPGKMPAKEPGPLAGANHRFLSLSPLILPLSCECTVIYYTCYVLGVGWH